MKKPKSKAWKERYYFAFLICFSLLTTILYPLVIFIWNSSIRQVIADQCEQKQANDASIDLEKCAGSLLTDYQIYLTIMTTLYSILTLHFAMVLRAYWHAMPDNPNVIYLPDRVVVDTSP